MGNTDNILKTLVSEVKQPDRQKPAPYDTPAEVRRVEDGIAWVHIPGGVDETPVKLTIAARPGDTVQIRVGGGSAWLVGNASAPPTDDRAAEAADKKAVQAQETAKQAVDDAGRAKEAADSAEKSAESAQISADNANQYASRALGGLSTVQSVVETLNWITEHGTMTLTTDTALDPTHVYFVVDPSGDYVVGSTHYSIVSEPDADDLSTYYVLSIDESLQNYVGTHLALTSEGLWLLPETSNYKVLIATGQGETYTMAGMYVVDDVGNIVAVYSNQRTYMVVSGLPVFDINSADRTENILVRKDYELSWKPIPNDDYMAFYYDIDIDDIASGEKIHVNLKFKFGETVMSRMDMDITQSLNTEETFTLNHLTFKTTLLKFGDQPTRLRIRAMTSDTSKESGYYKFSLNYIAYKAEAYAPSFSLGTRIDSAAGNGAFSTILGEGLVSRTKNQLVVGQYNQEDTDGNYATMVGNGSAFGSRKTTHGVTWDGDEELYLGTTQIDNALDAAISALGWDNDVTGLGVFMLSIKKILTKILQSLPQYQWAAAEATITVGASAGYTHTFTDITMPAKNGWGRQIIARCSNDKVGLCGWTWDSSDHPQIIVRNLTTSGTGVVVRVCCLYLRNENIFS